jgi:hypothetical protein
MDRGASARRYPLTNKVAGLSAAAAVVQKPQGTGQPPVQERLAAGRSQAEGERWNRSSKEATSSPPAGSETGHLTKKEMKTNDNRNQHEQGNNRTGSSDV